MDKEIFYMKPHITRKERRILLSFLDKVLSLPGDIAECGVNEGGTAAMILGYCQEHNCNKTVHLFDVFDKFPDLRTQEEHEQQDGTRGDIKRGHVFYLDGVEAGLKKNGFTNYKIHKGLFSETFPGFHQQLCFVHGDADIYQSMVEVSELVKRLLVKGGYYVIHDYGSGRWTGVKKAVDETLNPDYYNITHNARQLMMQRKE